MYSALFVLLIMLLHLNLAFWSGEKGQHDIIYLCISMHCAKDEQQVEGPESHWHKTSIGFTPAICYAAT